MPGAGAGAGAGHAGDSRDEVSEVSEEEKDEDKLSPSPASSVLRGAARREREAGCGDWSANLR